MSTFKALVILITICVAKSEVAFETMCKNNYTDVKNNQIDVSEYCHDKLCIVKCCGPDELIYVNGTTCINAKKLFEKPKIKYETSLELQYNTINILSSWDVNKKYELNNVFILNHRDVFSCTAEHNIDDAYEILQNGILRRQGTGSSRWSVIEPLKYCIDYKILLVDNKPTLKIVIRQNTLNSKEERIIRDFEIVGVLISSFFLLLVLVVYCLLPELRNLSGLVLMAYIFSLFFAFISKLVLTFVSMKPPRGFCKTMSPIVYFGFMSSIFWLSVISFDVWWTLRRVHKRSPNRRKELMRFMRYCLYAWGTPFLITAIFVTLDNIDISHLNIEKLPFDDCLSNDRSFALYFKIPIGILIFINIILFSMTVYHIWAVKHAVNKNENSRSSKKTDSLHTYLKLFLITGVSWSLELLPPQRTLLLYLINVYNLFTGVSIFYLYIFNKKILLALCRKFNIQNNYIKKLELESSQAQPNKSGVTKTTGLPGSSTVVSRSKDQQHEIDLLLNCPNEEKKYIDKKGANAEYGIIQEEGEKDENEQVI